MERKNIVKQPHILLFDDDPVFSSILKRKADQLDVKLTVCNDLSNFALNTLESNFDVVLIDYMLEEYRGPQVAKILEGQPALLVSSQKDLSNTVKDWPEEIKGFLSKTTSPETIINTALQLINKQAA